MAIYGNFVWWQGVVEDRIDPLMLGRCRVRILGYHTDDKTEGEGIPTEHLPWATIMQPTTSAAMSGIGTTPTGLVEGTWVIGFFRDGEDAQEPVIMGTIGGIPEERGNPKLGFNDPGDNEGQQTYPKDSYLPNPYSSPPKPAEPDTNRLARGNMVIPTEDSSCLTELLTPESNGEQAMSLKWKRATRMEGVPKALAGDLSSSISDTADPFYMGDVIDEDVDNFNYYWNEPLARYGGVKKSKTEFRDKVSSTYPKNHVRESECGHVEEWDDTPGSERLHRYHTTGTFEEIQSDGTRVVKVVGNDYEIVAGEKDVLISGDCNITVEGNCRLLTMGSMVQEVRGNYHLNVLGDMRVKVGGNMVQEIMSARKIKVEKDDDLKVGKSQVVNVGVNAEVQVGKDYSIGVGNHWNVNAKTISICGTKSVGIIGIVTCDIMGATVGIGSALLTKIESDLHISVAATSETHVLAAGYICGAGAGWIVTAGGLASITAGGAIKLTAGGAIVETAGGMIMITAGGFIKATATMIALN
jgi:hypothetical protein